jgi:hypothetical protein
MSVDQRVLQHMANAFEDEMKKIANASLKLTIPAEAGKYLAAAAIGGAAALAMRNAARDSKMGRLQRLNDELQAGDVWF